MKQSGEKYNEMKRKDAERKRIARATRKELSAAEVKREKELNVARVRRFRAKKREGTVEQPCSSYAKVDEGNCIGSYVSP